ncbi:phosphoadenosine phosphosulfate reductase domain-containing protein, partial [Staphylococcus saprophyticus]|uniref:phosphoadenosine phosphosulfate reductase domain-containing protein n=1 Tax=Staphylococcus saprophyticus TaxID=29385 RepID=UPI0037048551
MILIHLISTLNKHPQILFLHTNLHFQHTYHFIHPLKPPYPQLNINLKQPTLTLQQQPDQLAPALSKQHPNQSSYIPKIKP